MVANGVRAFPSNMGFRNGRIPKVPSGKWADGGTLPSDGIPEA